ncbi:Hypothetical protein NTJ_14106 [Nesidiocoris tenuis]|uniref:Secreted protein n=1 Tax=Nesidiocoris tenuis TaxID=355587 RepID=A0ABN7BA75_9HEMI|nr:Hypothetical protein NTJ_14106 [Nesidiocoris tenuis]
MSSAKIWLILGLLTIRCAGEEYDDDDNKILMGRGKIEGKFTIGSRLRNCENVLGSAPQMNCVCSRRDPEEPGESPLPMYAWVCQYPPLLLD